MEYSSIFRSLIQHSLPSRLHPISQSSLPNRQRPNASLVLHCHWRHCERSTTTIQDSINSANLNQTNTKPLPSSMQISKMVSLKIKTGNSLLWPCMLSIKDWYTWTRNTWIIPSEYSQLSIRPWSDVGGSIIVTDLQTAVKAIDVIVVKQDYVSFFFSFFIKKNFTNIYYHSFYTWDVCRATQKGPKRCRSSLGHR